MFQKINATILLRHCGVFAKTAKNFVGTATGLQSLKSTNNSFYSASFEICKKPDFRENCTIFRLPQKHINKNYPPAVDLSSRGRDRRRGRETWRGRAARRCASWWGWAGGWSRAGPAPPPDPHYSPRTGTGRSTRQTLGGTHNTLRDESWFVK